MYANSLSITLSEEHKPSAHSRLSLLLSPVLRNLGVYRYQFFLHDRDFAGHECAVKKLGTVTGDSVAKAIEDMHALYAGKNTARRGGATINVFPRIRVP